MYNIYNFYCLTPNNDYTILGILTHRIKPKGLAFSNECFLYDYTLCNSRTETISNNILLWVNLSKCTNLSISHHFVSMPSISYRFLKLNLVYLFV